MTRRQLLSSAPILGLSVPLLAQKTECRLRAGLVAYSMRKELKSGELSYEKLIHMVADLGLTGLDTTVYWFPDTTDQYLAYLRRTAYRNGVSLYSVSARVHLCQPTRELQDAEVQKARNWLQVAEKLGAGHLRIFGGAAPKGASDEQCIGWATEVVKRCAEIAEPKGICLGIEDDGGISTTAEQTIELMKRAQSPVVGINLDTGNFPRDGYKQVAMCLPYALNVHFKEQISNVAGEKEPADWNRLAGMFAQAGYRGYLSLEFEDPDKAAVEVPRYCGELRKLVQKYSG